MKLAAWIRQNTTVTEFAQKLGKSRAQVHRYMNGENLSHRVIEELCRETGGAVQPADFFASSREPEKVAS